MTFRTVTSALCPVIVVVCATLTSAQQRDWPSEGPPRPLPARQVNFPPYEIRTLANGMQVVTVLHHEQPAVSVRLVVRTGAAQDPKGKGGVSRLPMRLIRSAAASARVRSATTAS